MRRSTTAAPGPGTVSVMTQISLGGHALPRPRPASPLRMERQSGRASRVAGILSDGPALDHEAFTQIQAERGLIVAARSRPGIRAQAREAVPQECPANSTAVVCG